MASKYMETQPGKKPANAQVQERRGKPSLEQILAKPRKVREEGQRPYPITTGVPAGQAGMQLVGWGACSFQLFGGGQNSLQGGAESAVTSLSPAPEARGPLRSSQGDRCYSEKEKPVLRPCSAAPLGSRGWSGRPGRGHWGGEEGAGGEAVPSEDSGKPRLR